jgi:hypothetical protein
VITRIAARPMRVVRPVDLDEVYANPRAVLRDKARRGEVHKVAYGIYVAVPDDVHDPHRWRPGFEAAAGAIATAVFGDRRIVLTGMTAARVLRAVPRALGRATVAVPRRHRDIEMADRDHGVVDFVPRRIDDLDTMPVRTELGTLLVTTPEQTLVDLARERNHHRADVDAAMGVLAQDVDWARVGELLATQRVTATAAGRIRTLQAEPAA